MSGVRPPLPAEEQSARRAAARCDADPPVLSDAWASARPFALNGWLERNGFAPGLSALLVFVAAFLALNVVGAIVMALFAIPLAMEGGSRLDPQELMAAILEDAQVLLGSNAVALVFGMGLLALLAARLSTRDWPSFLRLRTPDLPGLGLAAVGWVVMLPVLLWSAQLNAEVPLPQWLSDLEQSQIEMLEGALLGSNVGVWFLLLTVALAPAICEELMFRGYLQRQVERMGGVVWSIVAVGLLFGIFHLRLSQAVPLSLLGMYLGLVTWTTGSLWTASLVHLLHNGVQVLVAVQTREDGQAAIEAMEDVSVPWLLALPSLLVFIAVCMFLVRRRREVVGNHGDSRRLQAAPTQPAAVSVLPNAHPHE